MAIEFLWLLIIVVVAAQIVLVLIAAIAAISAVHCFWLVILAVELIDYQVHKIGIGLCFYLICYGDGL